MPTRDHKRRTVEKDAEVLQEKFGPFADVYAQARSEAAEIAGDEAAGVHWQDVAATVDDEAGQ